MSAVNAASIYLQSKDVDLLTAAEKLKTAFEDLSSYREQFSDAVEEAKKVCSVWGLKQCSKISVWARRNGTLMSCACEDTRFDNPEYRFRVSVFHRLIDTVTSQITHD